MDWKPECDILLLQEIIVSEPYQYKSSTRERGKIWDEITERLNATEAFGNKLGQKRAVRDRYALLARKYKKKMAEEERASGISPEITEVDKLLEQIIESFEESDKDTAEKGEQVERRKNDDRKKAEEMRKLSMEKLGETLKRKGEEGGPISKKRASGSETIAYLKAKAERDFDLRKEELELKKRDQTQQTEMFQLMQQQLQQQMQQQQQQMQLQHQQQRLQTQLLMSLIEKLSKH